MTAVELLAAMELPAGARVQQRIPKKLLLENGAPTAADKRSINDGIEEIQWLSALKPVNVGIPAYSDEAREYLEIAVLQITFRDDAKTNRLNELVHRAIPYPVVLIATHGTDTTVSMAHKRWAQNEAGKAVLDGEPLMVSMIDATPEIKHNFSKALPLSVQSRSSLFALYQSWLDALIAFEAALQTGTFLLFGSGGQREARFAALHASTELRNQLVSLRAAAKKVSQMARQVDINLQIKDLERKLAQVKEYL
jgi:hypothetical protein